MRNITFVIAMLIYLILSVLTATSAHFLEAIGPRAFVLLGPCAILSYLQSSYWVSVEGAGSVFLMWGFFSAVFFSVATYTLRRRPRSATHFLVVAVAWLIWGLMPEALAI